MIRVRTIHSDDPNQDAYALLLSYASITVGEADDVMLLNLLKRGMCAVQETADCSLLSSTLEVTVTGKEHDVPARLYQTVSEIVSVKDTQGNPLTYTRKGQFIFVDAEDVVVTYKTAPIVEEYDRLLPVALQYATELYDGADGTKLSHILMQC